MKTKDIIFYWMRWILLIPVSLGVGFLISLCLEYILSFTMSKPDLELLMHSLSPLIISLLSVITAYWIAPNLKWRAVLIVCSLWIIVLAHLLAIIYLEIKLYGEVYEVKDGGIAITMVVCGLASGLFLIWRRNLRATKVE